MTRCHRKMVPGVTIKKISFKPANRRSSHPPAGQDRTRMCLTRGRVTSGQQSIRPGGTDFRHPQALPPRQPQAAPPMPPCGASSSELLRQTRNKPSTRRGNFEPGLTTPPRSTLPAPSKTRARVAPTARFRRPVTATRHRAGLTRHPVIELAGDGSQRRSCAGGSSHVRQLGRRPSAPTSGRSHPC